MRWIRRAQDLTQQELGKKANIYYTTISRLEAGDATQIEDADGRMCYRCRNCCLRSGYGLVSNCQCQKRQLCRGPRRRRAAAPIRGSLSDRGCPDGRGGLLWSHREWRTPILFFTVA